MKKKNQNVGIKSIFTSIENAIASTRLDLV